MPAASRFNAITDPDTAHAAANGMSFGDIIKVLQSLKASHHNVFRILGAKPLWSIRAEGQVIVAASTRVIAESKEPLYLRLKLRSHFGVIPHFNFVLCLHLKNVFDKTPIQIIRLFDSIKE